MQSMRAISTRIFFTFRPIPGFEAHEPFFYAFKKLNYLPHATHSIATEEVFRVSLKLQGINPEINHSFHAQTEDNVFSELIDSM